ncbi:hypothetical protein C2S51_030763 [Perilla frutescens var. frutescens]|nr:hypothetical protein C2S51_030763 [Perilla frutescens var. frutescens]
MSFSPPEVSSVQVNVPLPASQNSTDDQSSPIETLNSFDDAAARSAANTNNTSSQCHTAEDDPHFALKKRQKTSKKHQRKLILQPINEDSEQIVQLALTDGKFDMAKMRESVAHWILMHEHPFTIVEEEGFNMMQKRGIFEWQKVSQVFDSTTKIISGSEYPTFNLFLNEIYQIKVVLDKIYGNGAEDNDFLRVMVGAMKKKFDKYWGECNLLMSITAILDLRCKMRVIEFSFPKMYDKDEARDNIDKVKEALYELYNEYVAEMYSDGSTQSDEVVGSALNCTSS